MDVFIEENVLIVSRICILSPCCLRAKWRPILTNLSHCASFYSLEYMFYYIVRKRKVIINVFFVAGLFLVCWFIYIVYTNDIKICHILFRYIDYSKNNSYTCMSVSNNFSNQCVSFGVSKFTHVKTIHQNGLYGWLKKVMNNTEWVWELVFTTTKPQLPSSLL